MAEQPKSTEQKPNPFVEKYLSEEETRPLLLFSRKTQGTILLDAFKNPALKVGGCFQVKDMKHSTVVTAFRRLEKVKLVKRDEYQISQRGAKDADSLTFVIRLK